MKSIELHPAYRWDCDDCGRENFVRGFIASLPDDEMSQMKEACGIPEEDHCEWIARPTRVTCIHCKATFSVSYPLTFKDDDDDGQ